MAWIQQESRKLKKLRAIRGKGKGGKQGSRVEGERGNEKVRGGGSEGEEMRKKKEGKGKESKKKYIFVVHQ
jgi:hypothetical protein